MNKDESQHNWRDNDESSRVSSILEWTLSVDEQRRTTAERIICEMETRGDFYLTLMNLYENEGFPLHVRLLSLIIIKRNVDKKWKVRPPLHSVFEEVKDTLKMRLLNALNETDNKLSGQITAIIGKIVGFEYPRVWPEALNIFLSQLNKKDTPLKKFEMNIINVLKESLEILCSKVLLSSRQEFFNCAENIITLLYNTFTNVLSYIVKIIDNNEFDISHKFPFLTCQELISTAHTTQKCFHLVMIYGMKIPHLREEINDLLENHFNTFVNFCKFCENLPKSLGKKLLVNIVFSYMKTFNRLLNLNIYTQLSIASKVPIFYSNFLLNLLNERIEDHHKNYYLHIFQFLECLMKNCKSNEGINEIRINALNVEKVKIYALMIPQKFLCLNEEDMKLWELSPIDFLNNETGTNLDNLPDLHSPAESFMLVLSVYYRSSIQKDLIEIVSKLLASIGGTTTDSERGDPIRVGDSIRELDGFLCALGCMAESMGEFVDVEEWLSSNLTPKIDKLCCYDVLKYRLAWFIGRVIQHKESGEFHVYYGILVNLLKHEKLVIKVTAARSLQMIAENLKFRSKEFEPFFEISMERFMSLIKTIDDEILKSEIVSCMSDILEKIENLNIFYAIPIVQRLASIWEIYPKSIILRLEIIRAISKFVNYIYKTDSIYICKLVTDILRICVNEVNENYLYYHEAALDLWLSLLEAILQDIYKMQNESGTCDDLIVSIDPIIKLYPVLLDLMKYGTEHPYKLIRCLKHYSLLPSIVTMPYIEDLFSILNQIVKSLNVQCMHLLFGFLDSIMVMGSCCNTFDTIKTHLVNTKLLKMISLKFLNDSDISSITEGYMILLCRIILCDPKFILEYIKYIGTEVLNVSNYEIIDIFLKKVEIKSGSLMNKVQSRICGMAMINLITTNDILVIKNAHIIFNILALVFEDAELICFEDQMFPNNIEEQHDLQLVPCICHKIVKLNDPVYTQLSITNMIKRCVEEVYLGPYGEELKEKCMSVSSKFPTGLKNCLL